MKFNRISAEINRIVVQEVIASFLERTPQAGMSVRFVVAAEVAEDETEKAPFGGRGSSVPMDRKVPGNFLSVVPIRLEVE